MSGNDTPNNLFLMILLLELLWGKVRKGAKRQGCG